MLALVSTLTALSFSPVGAAEQARRAAIETCGIDARRLDIQPWPDFPIASLKVLGATGLSDETLRCFGVAVAAAPSVAPEFESGKLGERYSALGERDNLASARGMLAEENLLGRLPAYRPERDELDKFATRLERLCGATPRSVLNVERSVITLKKDAFGGPAAFRQVNCVINAGIATGHNPLAPPPVLIPTPLRH